MEHSEICVSLYEIKNVFKPNGVRRVELQKRNEGYVCLVVLKTGQSSYVWRSDKRDLKNYASIDMWASLFAPYTTVKSIKVILEVKQ